MDPLSSGEVSAFFKPMKIYLDIDFASLEMHISFFENYSSLLWPIVFSDCILQVMDLLVPIFGL